MRKRTVQLKTDIILLGVVLVFLLGTGAVKVNPLTDAPPDTGADLIVIDVLKTTGPLERPPVRFFHSRHTEALAKISRDCSACHGPDDKGRMSPKFKRTADADRQTVADIYHINCITCHRELTAKKIKSGPQTCGACHQENPAAVSTWTSINLDQSLHYRHVKANAEKCESCHHEYNKQTKQLVYAKGKEGACVYCHQEKPLDDTLALKQASHFQCIGCHRERAANNRQAGPVTCVGCHDADYQAGFKVIEDAPRLKRGQPDAVLVKNGLAAQPADKRSPAMNPVPFDHRGHETATASCKACHHASLASCSSCHTNTGKKEGGMVKLAQAMHSQTATASCIGCHEEQQKAPECAGCHALMSTTDRRDEAACAACHTAPLPPSVDSGNPRETAAIAADLLAARNTTVRTYTEDKIPDTVTIGHLANQFEPAAFPHRKIVKALVDRTRKSRLAGYFHMNEGTLCQGCHHNSPVAEKPPTCSSCHGQAIESGEAFKPGLAGAYHQQCIGCHTTMGIEKPAARDCNACHAARNRS